MRKLTSFLAIFALLTQIIMPSISFAADIPLSSSDVFLCNGGDCIGATSSLNYYTTTGVTLVSAVEDDVTNNVTITLSGTVNVEDVTTSPFQPLMNGSSLLINTGANIAVVSLSGATILALDGESVIVTNPALATLFASTYPDGTKTVTADDEAFALALDLDAASKIVTIDNGTNQIVIDYTNVEYYKPIELTGISVSLDPNSIAGYYTGLCGTYTCPTADVAVDVNGELMQAQMNIASGATQFFVTLDYTGDFEYSGDAIASASDIPAALQFDFNGTNYGLDSGDWSKVLVDTSAQKIYYFEGVTVATGSNTDGWLAIPAKIAVHTVEFSITGSTVTDYLDLSYVTIEPIISDVTLFTFSNSVADQATYADYVTWYEGTYGSLPTAGTNPAEGTNDGFPWLVAQYKVADGISTNVSNLVFTTDVNGGIQYDFAANGDITTPVSKTGTGWSSVSILELLSQTGAAFPNGNYTIDVTLDNGEIFYGSLDYAATISVVELFTFSNSAADQTTYADYVTYYLNTQGVALPPAGTNPAMDANYEDAFPWLVAKYTVSGVPATITGLVFTGSGVTYNFGSINSVKNIGDNYSSVSLYDLFAYTGATFPKGNYGFEVTLSDGTTATGTIAYGADVCDPATTGGDNGDPFDGICLPKPTPPTSFGGGGGGSSLRMDDCPNGDKSPSFYDGTCEGDLPAVISEFQTTGTTSSSNALWTEESRFTSADLNAINLVGLDATMISNLKSQLNGNKVADLLDVVKVGNKLALKLKVFSALNNPNGALIEAAIDNLYAGKLTESNLQDVIYYRNKAVLIVKKYLNTNDASLVPQLRDTLVNLLLAIGKNIISTEEEAANFLASKGFINDNSANPEKYELNNEALRQEIAAVARGIAKVPLATEYKGLFVDVTDTKPNSWVWAVVEPMKELGLLASNERFNPEQDITKAEGIGMMIKAIYGSEYSYNSNLTTTWQEQVVAFSLSKGITDSFSDYNAKATRGFIFLAGAKALNRDIALEQVIDFLKNVGINL